MSRWPAAFACMRHCVNALPLKSNNQFDVLHHNNVVLHLIYFEYSYPIELNPVIMKFGYLDLWHNSNGESHD